MTSWRATAFLAHGGSTDFLCAGQNTNRLRTNDKGKNSRPEPYGCACGGIPNGSGTTSNGRAHGTASAEAGATDEDGHATGFCRKSSRRLFRTFANGFNCYSTSCFGHATGFPSKGSRPTTGVRQTCFGFGNGNGFVTLSLALWGSGHGKIWYAKVCWDIGANYTFTSLPSWHSLCHSRVFSLTYRFGFKPETRFAANNAFNGH